MEIVNLTRERVVIDTPGIRAIALWDVDAGFDSPDGPIRIGPGKQAASVAYSMAPLDDVAGARVWKRTARIAGLPEPRQDTVYVAYRAVAELAQRDDVLYAGGLHSTMSPRGMTTSARFLVRPETKNTGREA